MGRRKEGVCDERDIRKSRTMLTLNPQYEEIFDARHLDMDCDGIADGTTKQFGSFEVFQKEFVQKGTTLFGSGWAWLSADDDGRLVITQEANANNPITKGLRPLLTFDIWEHA